MNKISDKRLYTLTLKTNVLKIIVSSIIGVIIVPISLNYWQTERYGIWLLLNSLLVYLTVSNLGLNSAASILMNKNSNSNNKMIILKRCTGLILISVFLLLIFAVIANLRYKNWIQILGKIPKTLEEETQKTAFILILFFLINVPFSLVTAALNGFHKVYITNLFSIVGSMISLVAVFLNIYLKGDLFEYAIIVGISNLFISLLHVLYFYIYIYTKVCKEEVVVLDDENSYTSILVLGIRCFAGSVASMVVLNTDNIVISHFLGIESVTPFAITFKIYMILFNIIYVLNSSIVPLIGRKIGEGNVNDVQTIYERTFYVIIYVGGGIWIGAVGFFKNLIILWSGINGYAGFMALFFLGAYSYVFAIVNLNYIMINTFNYIKGIVWIVWAEAIINLGTSIFFLKYWGLGGVALGTFLGTFLSPFFLFPIVLKKRSNNAIKMDTIFFLKHTFILVIPFVLVATIFHYYISTFTINIFAVIALLLLYSVCYYVIVPASEAKYFIDTIIRVISKKGVKV